MTSRVALPVTGATRLFTVPFPFLHRDHVRFAVNRVLQLNPLNFTWVSETTVEFATAPSGVLEITRQTPADNALVSFRNGAALTEAELNLAVLQNLYIAQELRDYYDALINGSLDKLVLASGGNEAGSVIDKVTEEILNSALLAELRARITDIDTNAETINAQRIRLDTVEEVVDALSNVEGQSIATFLQDEQQARIDGDTALASDISLIGAKSGDGLSWILDLAKVKVSPTESIGSRLQAINTTMGQNTAAIATEQTTRATEDAALATQVSNVNARVGAAEGLITQEQTARANADSALTSRVDGMLATVNDNRALILAEQTARANGDSAEASARQTLQTQVNGNTSSIQTHAQTLNGLSAQYTVKLDVNGYVTGFGLYNQGSSSAFYVLADKFAVVTPGQAPTVPFAVDANGVYMNTAYIRNLVVDKISGGAITSQWNINNNNGRIVLDTGTAMKVIGVGFGANSDLVTWFGPKMPVSSCSKANAKSWEDIYGNAYHGGTLRAGTLYNAMQTTSSGYPVSAVIGPFATNGNQKTVVVSYSYRNGRDNHGSSIGNGPGGIATVKLYRTIGGGNEVLLATYQCQATRFSEFQGGGIYIVDESASGSWTYTDSTAGTQNFQYRVEVADRSGFASIPLVPVQSAGAVITEE